LQQKLNSNLEKAFFGIELESQFSFYHRMSNPLLACDAKTTLNVSRNDVVVAALAWKATFKELSSTFGSENRFARLAKPVPSPDKQVPDVSITNWNYDLKSINEDA